MIEKIQNSFFDICNENYSIEECELFEKAINFAKEKLNGKFRLTGNPAIYHNLRIGIILAENKMFSEVVVAGLLYDVEGECVPSEIYDCFSKEISDLVYGQLQLKDIKSKNKNVSADVLRKIFLVTLKDPRVILVKLADKLDNLETIDVFSKNQKMKIAEEVLDIYSPLALRLGADKIKKRLEDLAFKIINPRKYKEIEDFLNQSGGEREEFIQSLIGEIKILLKNLNILEIKGREKQIYSIYKKITERKVPLHKQKDHFAVRIIAASEEDCYNVLGVLHKHYDSVPGTLKDYIGNPKPNGYQSLHTVLDLDFGKKIEVQIRTKKMDDIAEEGLAAHWNYKKIKSDFGFEKKVGWLRSILDLKLDKKNKDLLKSVQLSIFGDRIYCYTPKGKSIDLPKGASVLDFAYHIHQEIGNKAIGGRVNGKFVSLRTELKHGDVVEIITNKCQKPRRDWMKFVVSARAKAMLKKEIKKHEGIPVTSRCSLKKQDKSTTESLVYSEELPNHNFELARCCYPVPNKEIVGVIKSHKRVLVHLKNCKNLDSKKDHIVPVFWKDIFNRPIYLFVQAVDRPGVLADFLNRIVKEGFVVKEASAKLLGGDLVESKFVIVPRKLEEIVDLIKKIEKVQGFKKVRFE